MPSKNILKSGRPVLYWQRATLEDNTTAGFGLDAIEICPIIPSRIRLTHNLVKIKERIKLIQLGRMTTERKGVTKFERIERRRRSIIINFCIIRQLIDLAKHAQLFFSYGLDGPVSIDSIVNSHYTKYNKRCYY